MTSLSHIFSLVSKVFRKSVLWFTIKIYTYDTISRSCTQPSPTMNFNLPVFLGETPLDSGPPRSVRFYTLFSQGPSPFCSRTGPDLHPFSTHKVPVLILWRKLRVSKLSFRDTKGSRKEVPVFYRCLQSCSTDVSTVFLTSSRSRSV